MQRRLVKRLISISDAIKRLACGDADTALPAISTKDEMGEMARALEVLQAGELERRKLVERERDEQVTQRRRANSIDSIIDGKMVTAEASAIYQKVTQIDPASIDPASLHGRLIRMQLDSISEVMDVHQETLKRQGVGFKGFIPAVFSRLVNEAFGRRAGGIAEIKVTAPPMLVRNPKVQPDPWELDIIKTKLLSSSWPKGQSYTAAAAKDGVQAMRTVIPEYYGRSCLACHGTPQGEIDITGFPKEGANEGDLGSIISITLYR